MNYNQWKDFYSAVDKQISKLQRDLLYGKGGTQSAAKRDLANLRRASSRPVGSNPDVWNTTIDLVPDKLKGDEGASIYEMAAHITITSFALHQQSKDRPMHREGVSFAEAVGKMAVMEERSNRGVWSRFCLLLKASKPQDLQRNIRSMISLLRSSNLAFDYADLCQDLVDLQTDKADLVRLKWGRNYSAGTRSPRDDQD